MKISLAAAAALAALAVAPPAGARSFENTGELAAACQRMTAAGGAGLTVEQLAETGQLRGYVDATIDSIEALYPDICLPEMSLAQVCAAALNWYAANPGYAGASAYAGLVHALKRFYPCPPPGAPVP